jgi:hypothetical protein
MGGYLGAIAEKEHNQFWGAIAEEDMRKHRIETEIEKMDRKRKDVAH